MSVYTQPRLAQDSTWQCGRFYKAAVPSTGLVFNPPARAIAFSSTGVLVAVGAEGGDATTFPDGSLAMGIVHPVTISEIKSTSTVQGIVLFW